MANKFITALFGDYSKKEVKRLGKTKQKVLDLEEKYQAMDDKELTAQTAVLNPGWRTARLWTTFCRTHLPSAVRLPGVCWV